MRYEASELVPIITTLSCCFNACKALFIPVWKSLFVEVPECPSVLSDKRAFTMYGLRSRTTFECYFGFKHLRWPLSYVCLFGWKIESNLNKV